MSALHCIAALAMDWEGADSRERTHQGISTESRRLGQRRGIRELSFQEASKPSVRPKLEAHTLFLGMYRIAS